MVRPSPHRRNLRRHLSFVVAASLALTACSSADEATAPDAASRTLATAQGSCDACVFVQTFTRGRGTPVTEHFVILGNRATDYLIDVTDHGDRGANAEVRLNDAVIVASTQVSAEAEFHLVQSVALGNSNTLTVRLTGKPDSRLSISIRAGAKFVGSDGGSLQLSDVARFTFPQGLFTTAAELEVTRTDDPVAASNFAEFEGLFRVASKADQLIRLLAGSAFPAGAAFSAAFVVPPSLTIPSGTRPEVFMQEYETAGEEILDNFQFLTSVWDEAARTLTVTVPARAFTSSRRSDGRQEALFMVATTPGGLGTTAAAIRVAPGVAVRRSLMSTCQAALIQSPVPPNTRVSSPFGSGPNPFPPPATRWHWGADLAVTSSTQVTAAADGTVERIRRQVDGAGSETGYGLYLILRHADKSATLYAHLQRTLLAVNQPVTRGAPLALSDNSGSSTNPHLHLEYVPNGEIVQNKERIDPIPCLTTSGTIFSTFGQNDSYNTGFPRYGVGIFSATPAMNLVAGSNGKLESIRVAVSHNGGINSYSLSIASDNSGQPGNLLETIGGLVFPISGGIVTAQSSVKPTLAAGSAYWVIMAAPNGIGSHGSWWTNDRGIFGGSVRYEGNGFTWTPSFSLAPALEVNTTPP